MAVDGKSQYPIETFTMNRPAVTDCNFKCPDHGIGIHRGHGAAGNTQGIRASRL